ncbi:MAG: spermidine/putrescine ABC transporter substrate-binding protein PotF [Oceanospirillaceae bacterium]|uniref:polyamine ABC transporter substrate-binding protein n=1 Tax=unclassified Thalassolituus TaxID=2624967 RepID=UPI000C5D726D|nr:MULTISPECIES: polyamine ABC transporter substrate-binding protein [unclassified Thalassolituus]MAS25548.1 spermidine/putrescine ABC transporter substrate-binding protein PotF [Oceanospirillaceae bacterium]MAX99132.1 spermidine/putrescine ABC transporter substrate-binding protein PotF [Oceanospirillaceae bacterium]MBL36206.1 spermidine/putrescine ABC transporter substrate-binding protein PotF [Oceanospirillaceae bacterium]MBS55106.1 spermidine/putrescine ABC transporter substrate-binding prot|tara:strand:- start:9825 stop:10916 length:1092 start_codon:yes stop_codon:yes gene_type:complete
MTLLKTIKTSALLAALAVSSAHAEQELNIFNWSDYMSPDAIPAFEKQTGLKVNYDVYDSNEMLEAKLMTGSSGYDIVVPTGSFLERQIKAGIYAEIDKSKLKNYGNLDKELLAKVEAHDPGNKYGVPYAWGTIGIGYNVDAVKKRLGDQPVDSLDILFKPELSAKLKDCGVVMLDSPAEIMSVALNYLGLDPNSENKADLAKAEELLKANRDNYRYFHSSRYIDELANGEICVALGYNGDVLIAQGRAAEAENGVNVDYAIPSEGTMIWFDLMAIPADAPHKEAAYQFIDYVLSADVAAGISNYVYYAVPNTAAEPLLEDEVKNHPGIYPSAAVKAKLFSQKAHSAKFDRILNRAWTNVRTGR